MYIRFDRMYEPDGRTDGQTDGHRAKALGRVYAQHRAEKEIDERRKSEDESH